MNGGQGTSVIHHISDLKSFEHLLNEMCTSFLITQLLIEMPDKQCLSVADSEKATA